MPTELMTYYIPKNPHITKGPIYALYINHNTNLDLASIIPKQNIENNDSLLSSIKPIHLDQQIIITKEEYTKLLELNNKIFQLTSRRTKNIENFIKAETKTTEELAKVNNEREKLINQLTKKGIIS